MKKKLQLRFTAADAVLLLILSGVPLLLPGGGNSTDRLYVRIVHPAGEYRYPLEQNRLITLNGSHGQWVAVISNRQVRVVESHCPGGHCLRMGPVDSSGEAIVCLPQRIAVELVGAPPLFDAIGQ